MRQLILDKIKRHWDDKLAFLLERELDGVDQMNDLDLLEFYDELRDMGFGRSESALLKDNERMKEELRRLYGVDRPFICGYAGEDGADNMKEFVLVCPSYGADGFAMYKKHKDYSAPGY